MMETTTVPVSQIGRVPRGADGEDVPDFCPLAAISWDPG